MTIFYCGKVNVYDDMPEDKAQSILNIAASPVQIQERPVDGTMMTQPLPCLSNAFGAKAHPDSAVLLPTLQKVKMYDHTRVLLGEESHILREETPMEGSSTRKASVQRYLDKKKDRFKSKRKAGISSCASLDRYFNHQIPNEPLSRSNTCSPPPQIRPPSTPNRCSSVVNDSLKNVSASTDIIN
ncbi:protein tify 4b [Phtheirospermum japonicum]|uniref:Protein TIFY n=1 Tax=Phtheirospermum japonicum TaxID=374723 RepID=A0A830B9P6_9LAMI|nr:protein tify 4b [Phtheirospermum japonicum]